MRKLIVLAVLLGCRDDDVTPRFDALVDRTCACTDRTCGERAIDDMIAFLKATPDGPTDNGPHFMEQGKRLVECAVRAGVPPKTLERLGRAAASP